MNTTFTPIVAALGAVILLFPSSLRADPIIESRVQSALQFLMSNSWPYPSTDHLWDDERALLLLASNQQIATANQLIETYIDNNPTVDAVSTYADTIAPTNLFKIYLAYYACLTPSVRQRIEDEAFAFVNHRSQIDPAGNQVNNAGRPTWFVVGSENHDVSTFKVPLLLGCRVLCQSPVYGSTVLLNDNNTVQEHYDAWIGYFHNYVRDRAKEGMNCEINHSASYGRSTMNAVYTLYDYSGSTSLRQSVGNFLSVYWILAAQEYCPATGIRGGIAGTRIYEKNWYQTGSYWAKALLYAYNWTNLATNPDLTNLGFFLSTYRPPDIARAIAVATHSYFQTTARHFGRGGVWNQTVYSVVFDANNASSIIRSTYCTPNYVMSCLSFDPSKSYIELARQSRIMGLTFSSGVNDRVVIMGSYTGSGGFDTNQASAAINGVLKENAMVIAQDVGQKNNSGPSIFISNGTLWNNRIENDNGWFFSMAGNGYVGIKIANGGYSLVTTTNGYILKLNDQWSPIVVQSGDASKDGTFDQFKTNVKARTFTYSGGLLNYTSLKNHAFQYWSQSTTLPKINGTTVNLNPNNTYSSPYLSMVHGSDTFAATAVNYPTQYFTFP